MLAQMKIQITSVACEWKIKPSEIKMLTDLILVSQKRIIFKEQ